MWYMKQHPEISTLYVTPSGEVWTALGGFGNVHSGPRKLLKSHINRVGYEYIRQKNKKYLVHRLVAQTYIENPNNLPMVNHKDECKTNNNVSNLEWCNNQYNCEYSNAKTYTLEYNNELIVVTNLEKFCRNNNLNVSCIRRSRNTGWRHKGYILK